MRNRVDAGTLLVCVRVLFAVAVAVDPRTGGPSPYLHYAVALLAYPRLFRRGLGVQLTVQETLVVGVTLLLHPVAVMYGIYDAVWWFDHLTHALSAMVVASIGFVLIEVTNRQSSALSLTPEMQYAATVWFVFAAGIVWEIYEMYEVQFLVLGPYDTATDLLFDVVGAVVVLAFGADYLRALTADVEAHFDRFRTDRE